MLVQSVGQGEVEGEISLAMSRSQAVESPQQHPVGHFSHKVKKQARDKIALPIFSPILSQNSKWDGTEDWQLIPPCYFVFVFVLL